jgi:capsular polysaccharide biosynthesis protein
MTQKLSDYSGNYFVPGFLKMKQHQYLVSFSLMIIFAVVGLLVSFVFLPKYEAESYLITNLELVQDTNVTEVMVDSQLELIGQLMYHPDITNEVLRLEESAGNPTTLAQLKKTSMIERRLMTTVIKVRDEDPEIAARIASNWVEVAFNRLSEAYEHALLVSEAKWTITSIEDCQTDPMVLETSFCQNLTADEVNNLTNYAHDVILVEAPKALGLTKDLQISQFQPASIPEESVQGTRSNLMLAGALIGLVLSLIVFELPVFKIQAED